MPKLCVKFLKVRQLADDLLLQSQVREYNIVQVTVFYRFSIQLRWLYLRNKRQYM